MTAWTAIPDDFYPSDRQVKVIVDDQCHVSEEMEKVCTGRDCPSALVHECNRLKEHNFSSPKFRPDVS